MDDFVLPNAAGALPTHILSSRLRAQDTCRGQLRGLVGIPMAEPADSDREMVVVVIFMLCSLQCVLNALR